MKKGWRYTLLGFFFGMVLLGGVTLRSIYSVQSHGQLINYVGIVRGATQRLVKLELSGQPNDQLITYLDEILENLVTGEGKYGLILADDFAYQESLDHLIQQWQILKTSINTYRTDPSVGPILLEQSEAYFELANETVFSAEAFSASQTQNLMLLIVILFICMLVIWFFILLSQVRRMLHLESTNKDLSDKAGRDPLTGAYNAERFKSIAQLLLDSHFSTDYAVFYVDFENFKYINDVFGYARGDSILQNYATILQEDMAKDEAFGRINADNFVILRRYSSKQELTERQKAVDHQITEYMLNFYDNQSLPLCCGICCVKDVVENLKIEELMDRANFARKTVKNGSYDRYRFYDESIRQKLFEEKAIESSMASALKNLEFVVYYQPKVSLHTGRIACSEALVRWQKPDGTIIPPDMFIPVFEKNHTIPILDQYVFEKVCAWLRHLLDTGKQALPVSVNVSRLQFYNPDFVNIYTAIREKYQVPPALLEIEFTETILIDNWPLMAKIVGDLQSRGFSCAIDDFGKGYSSMSSMKNLNIDVLKIDALYFQDIDALEKDRKLVAGIINLVRQFGIVTVAEGIESKDQVEFLRQAQCDMIQGYVFYKPMPQSVYEELLDSFSPAQEVPKTV